MVHRVHTLPYHVSTTAREAELQNPAATRARAHCKQEVIFVRKECSMPQRKKDSTKVDRNLFVCTTGTA